uniref:Uncharacterized protein n=1 Tax=Ananas comosus var. bracteatus TaxID=296719 RepID=A0A6V7PLM2_ANACO|nr:unnamed protein product [Ananas comosus var. bracteatus]
MCKILKLAKYLSKTSRPSSSTIDSSIKEISEKEKAVEKIKKDCGIMDGISGPLSSQNVEYMAGLNDQTKCTIVESFILNSKYSVFRTLDAVEARGGLLMAWNPYLFDCIEDRSGFFSLNLVLKRKMDEAAALEDFNILPSVQDKNKITSNIFEILKFRELINDIGLLDMPLLNRSFT